MGGVGDEVTQEVLGRDLNEGAGSNEGIRPCGLEESGRAMREP